VDWTITNPPWSLARQFLQHAYRVADNIVFLIPIAHVLSLRVRIAEMQQAGFRVKEILLCPTPGPPWASSGFQLGAVHLQRGYRGTIIWGWLGKQNGAGATGGNGSADLVFRPSVHVMRASAFAIPLTDGCIQTVVTSPSYFGLRRYPGGTEKDLGRENTVGQYVEHLVMAMREVWRVLRNDGVVFLNIADSYHGSGRGAGKNGTNDMKMNPLCAGTPLRGQGKAKSLCLIPHRVMIALQNDGWIIRNDIVWEKPNVVPGGVKDRCTSSYEHVIVLVKSKKYYWNQEEAREASVCWERGSLGGGVTASRKDGKMTAWTMGRSNKSGSSRTEKRLSTGDVLMEDGSVKWHPVGVGPKGDALINSGAHGERAKLSPPIGNVKHQQLGNATLVGNRMVMKPTRNIRDVWHINTRPHKDAHIAMFPEELVERCIRIGSKEGDLVLDPFAGSGTTGLVARQLKRNAVLLDISAEYCELMKNRLSQQPEAFESLPVAENKATESSGDPMLDLESGTPPSRKQIVVVNQEFVSWARTYSGPKFHACLCDPSYGYHFMGAKWDDPKQPTKNQVHAYMPSGQRMTRVHENIVFQQACKEWGEAMLSHLYPGALVMMFAGPRMFEWLSTGMQLAGFDHWETFCWLHAQGFPKAQAIGANAWQGYKTPALKPAWEAILCFRAPREGMTYAELATKYGSGCLNVDGGRIGPGAKKWDTPKGGIWHPSESCGQRLIDNPLGRYPANVILDQESAIMLEAQKIGASRFFYVAKASKKERNAGCGDLPNDHPCVKPLALTRYLGMLLLPPDSVSPRRLMVPFAGSGSEMIGAEQAGWDEVVGIEQNPHYCEIAKLRLQYWRMAGPPSSPGRNDAPGMKNDASPVAGQPM
jgi:DNA modification methylase